MTDQEMLNRLRKALEMDGGTHNLDDILGEIAAGNMQSFVGPNGSWVITQVLDFPRQRVLEILWVVGHILDFDYIYPELEKFAKDRGCTLMRGLGRDGWDASLAKLGWRTGQKIFIKAV